MLSSSLNKRKEWVNRLLVHQQNLEPHQDVTLHQHGYFILSGDIKAFLQQNILYESFKK